MSIGSNIAGARGAKGWSQRELARRSGVSYTHIQQLEGDEASPTIRTLERLSSALGVAVGGLIGSEWVANPLAESLARWLDAAPAEKRDLVFQVAEMAGFAVGMSLAAE